MIYLSSLEWNTTKPGVLPSKSRACCALTHFERQQVTQAFIASVREDILHPAFEEIIRWRTFCLCLNFRLTIPKCIAVEGADNLLPFSSPTEV